MAGGRDGGLDHGLLCTLYVDKHFHIKLTRCSSEKQHSHGGGEEWAESTRGAWMPLPFSAVSGLLRDTGKPVPFQQSQTPSAPASLSPFPCQVLRPRAVVRSGSQRGEAEEGSRGPAGSRSRCPGPQASHSITHCSLWVPAARSPRHLVFFFFFWLFSGICCLKGRRTKLGWALLLPAPPPSSGPKAGSLCPVGVRGRWACCPPPRGHLSAWCL